LKFELGGVQANYDSVKSRAEVVNLYPEGDKSGYKTLRKCEGLTLFATLPLGPVRSEPLVNSGYVYVVSGSTLYRADENGVVETLGVVNGTGRAKLAANSRADILTGANINQILILNGSGVGYIHTEADGVVAISDVDFSNSSSVTVLDERFWLARDNSNEFFGSDTSDGTSYNPLTFESATESPDEVLAVMQKKSALWVIGGEKIEYWQGFNDATVPLRKVKGGTSEYGTLNTDTVAEVNDFFAFLADDRTVRLMNGTQLAELSDLDFQLKIKGNGTATLPGFDVIDDAYGFFVDGPVHSIYYITFPTEKYTIGFDIKTGMSHRRESEGLGYWRVNGSAKFGTKIICGDSTEGKLWTLDTSNRTENDGLIRTKLITPSISFPHNVTISDIEIDMEVAQTSDPTADPQVMVYYTKDGGNTWIQKGNISVGKYGNHEFRAPLRNFGRLVRNKEFALRLETTDDIGVQYYGAEIHMGKSI
jgi:hypothetical protein